MPLLRLILDRYILAMGHFYMLFLSFIEEGCWSRVERELTEGTVTFYEDTLV